MLHCVPDCCGASLDSIRHNFDNSCRNSRHVVCSLRLRCIRSFFVHLLFECLCSKDGDRQKIRAKMVVHALKICKGTEIHAT